MDYITAQEFSDLVFQSKSAVMSLCRKGCQGDVSGLIGARKVLDKTQQKKEFWQIPYHYVEHLKSLESRSIQNYCIHLRLYNINRKKASKQ